MSPEEGTEQDQGGFLEEVIPVGQETVYSRNGRFFLAFSSS